MRMSDTVQNRNTDTRGVTHFNFHVIFSEKINVNDIENFIKSLECENTTIGSDYGDKSKLIKKKVNFTETLRKLIDKKFKDKFLIWLPYDEYGGIGDIDPKSDGWIKERFIAKSHILGSSNEDQINFFLWKSKLKQGRKPKFSQEEFENWFKCKKPCIKGSDSHSYKDPIGKLKNQDSQPIEKFCWIKADTTFEGLKQIVYEPEERVKIQKDNPAFEFNKPYFKKIVIENEVKVFQNEEVKFKKKELLLNKNLVTIIGGRGTGKSLLINYFASTFNKYKNENFVSSNNFIVFYEKDNSETDNQCVEYKEFENHLEFLFIQQSKIKQITEAGGLENEIKKLLGLEYLNFNENLSSEINEISGEIEKLQAWFLMKNENGDKINNKEYNQKIKKENTDLLTTIKTHQNQELLNNYTNNITEKNNLESNEILIKKFEEYLTQIQNNINQEIQKINSFFAKEKNLQIQNIDFTTIAEKLEKQKEFLQNQIKVKATENTNIKSNFEIMGYKGDLTELLKNTDSYQSKIKEAEKKLDEIAQQEESLRRQKNKRKELGKKIQKEYTRHVEIFLEKWRNLLSDKDEKHQEIIKKTILNQDINLEVKINFNEKEFYQLIFDNVDKRTYRTTAALKEYFGNIDNIDSWVNFFKEDRFDQIFEDDNFKEFIDDILFDLNKRSQYIKVLPDLTYKKKSIDKLSAGQKGTLYLRLQLATSAFSTPIIFDQPEDDLDNDFIIKELVPLIKELKKYRQMILVTHNANIVINADADQIIIARNNDEILNYENGAIENEQIRLNVCNFLEGGKNAFEKRKNKYNF